MLRHLAFPQALLVLLLVLSPAPATPFQLPLQQPQLPTAGRNLRCTAARSAAHTGPTMMAEGNKKGVLFVCLGNICRSPTAEAVFTSVVGKAGRSDEFDIDSCGTGGGSSNWYKQGGFSYHEGEDADSRMKETAEKRGVYLTSVSRPLEPKDFERFDAIVYMDDANRMAITEAANHWKIPPDEVSKRTCSMMAFAKAAGAGKSVPDPYYGGTDGFEKVLDLLDDACEGLLESFDSTGRSK
mmetsp:Transcript_16664/g.32855  ORF Transcript_16664/g.32855 Transcript_16664/m.32855 type:complete len:240 (+) Transcript_16664:103-822(+)|eukprot:CAMPEP_0173383746 /NCGR_PEP_ID=MMETSP1356-20130122/6323_1 /TAXON_ID=77927 ORGANISM="Hemiselmis virescens, Strain PCC157" /NCGR_SAMPLE_ID=MMETSP1356 /ASSEMBLY_ACC=CAM_ASM_000847 /LENGTH=239 /DNA_ID=CAMNT_0014338765 /DNA_START=103 /DNA_END=822 /DNA_ORIENTATION=-